MVAVGDPRHGKAVRVGDARIEIDHVRAHGRVLPIHRQPLGVPKHSAHSRLVGQSPADELGDRDHPARPQRIARRRADRLDVAKAEPRPAQTEIEVVKAAHAPEAPVVVDPFGEKADAAGIVVAHQVAAHQVVVDQVVGQL